MMSALHKTINTIFCQGHKNFPGRFCYQRFVLMLVLMLIMSTGWLTFEFQPARAQEAESLLVQPPGTDHFPILSVQFKHQAIYGHGEEMLQPEQLSVIENNQEKPILSLEQEYQGVHFTLAINGSRELDLRDADSRSPFDKMTAVLLDWVESKYVLTADTWSLVFDEAVKIRHSSTPDAWIDELKSAPPNFRMMQPTLSGLETALTLAKDRVVPFGVDKVLLYITPPPTPEQISPLTALAEEARSAGVYVNVWMVGDAFFLNNDQGRALIDLAARTGGQFFHFNGNEPIPEPAALFAEFGTSYTLTYDSGIRETGTYPLRIQATLPDRVISGESTPFYLDVQPPKVIFVSPPLRITRQADPETEDSLEALEPNRFLLNIMVEFPDSYHREIVASRLYVDGRVVDVRTTQPFTTLTWDLSALTESGEHTIQVEVDDSLGLSDRSALVPVQIAVVFPEPEPRLTSGEIGMIISGAMITLAFVILIVWLVRRFGKQYLISRVKIFLPGLKKLHHSEQKYLLETDQKVSARLIPLNGLEFNNKEQIIDITQSQVSFVCNPDKTCFVINEKDAESLHAQLNFQEGNFWLKDLGSTKGTWVNYDQIGTDPVLIFPGDLIHFGNSGFRFTIIDTQNPSTATVSDYTPIL